MDLSLKHLQTPLPEDIEKLKGHGDFKLAAKLIDKRLKEDLPHSLRQRLVLEKELLERIPSQYPYSKDQAFALLQEKFVDVTWEDIDQLRQDDAADWYYVEGELRFKDDFIFNIIKTRPQWAARIRDLDNLVDAEGNFSLLDQTIASMKEKGSLAFEIKVAMTMKINKDAHSDKLLRVHLPLPVEYAQVKNLQILTIKPEPKFIAPPQQMQRTVYFEGNYPVDQEFRVEFSFENHVDFVNPDPDKVSQLQPNFYMQEQEPHIVFTHYIKELTKEIVGDEINPLLKARKIYDFVTTKIIYSFVRPYFTMTNIPEFCATSRKGDCGVLALLFITMCRCAGLPARWQSGLYANPLSIGNHDWAQYYVEPYGWLFADCSFGGAAFRAGKEDRWNFYASNLEPFRIPFASGFQQPFNPDKKFLRNDPYDNQNGEAEYEDRGLIAGEYTTESILLSIKEL